MTHSKGREILIQTQNQIQIQIKIQIRIHDDDSAATVVALWHGLSENLQTKVSGAAPGSKRGIILSMIHNYKSAFRSSKQAIMTQQH